MILGKPNAGKSSLLNVLSGAGTCDRDGDRGNNERCSGRADSFERLNLNMIDTAGIRQTEDVVEKIGVEKAREYAESADLIIYVADASRKLDENDREIAQIIAGKKVVVLLNKSDLEPVLTREELRTFLEDEFPVIEVSAKEEKGIRELEQQLKTMFLKRGSFV